MRKSNPKPWERLDSRRSRKIGTRNQINTFLIVCEGEATETEYFKSFPVKKKIVELDIRGEGMNTLSLVDRALELRDKGIRAGTRYNQVWCVFDKDSFDTTFNAAIYKAHAHSIRTAYTNEAFELWFLLHFMYCDSALSRKQYGKKLSEYIGKKYRKNDKTLYDTIRPHQETAIHHAIKLRNRYSPHNPVRDNPCTTVHLLVEALNEFCETIVPAPDKA